MFASKWKILFFNNSKYLPSVESKSVSLFWEAVLVVSKNETLWCHPMPFLLSIITHHMGAMLLTIGDVCKWVRGCDWGQVEWKRSSTLIIEKCIPVRGLGDFSKGKKKSKFYSWEESKLVNLPSIVNDAITLFKFI